MRFVLWLLYVVILIVAVVFAVSNRQMVMLDLWPSTLQLHMPLALLACGFFLLGCFVGAVTSFLMGLKDRFAHWRLRKAVKRLKKDLEDKKPDAPKEKE
ncbi:MAG: LapA family protein [Alphaproteobacteria bacterium]|nr:LapA family protein [Alphaproteobacteria bacterium]